MYSCSFLASVIVHCKISWFRKTHHPHCKKSIALCQMNSQSLFALQLFDHWISHKRKRFPLWHPAASLCAEERCESRTGKLLEQTGESAPHPCWGAQKSAAFLQKENIWEVFRRRCFCVLDVNKLIVHSAGNRYYLKRQLKLLKLNVIYSSESLPLPEEMVSAPRCGIER